MKKNMNKFFHLSFEINEEIGVFIPGIPSGMANEDNTTKRVCVADTVKGCLFAMPLFSYITDGCDDPYEILDYMRLNKKTNKADLVLRVYEFEVHKEDEYFMSNQEIVQKKLVPDAFLSGESWILRDVEPTDSYLIMLTNVEKTSIKRGTRLDQMTECPIQNVEYIIIDDINQLEEHSPENIKSFIKTNKRIA